MRLLFATGGSGGHVYPALAVAHAATKEGHEAIFIGEAGGVEEGLVTEAGYPFTGVPAGKWHRGSPDPRQAVRAASGLLKGWSRVRQLKPDLVMGFGGFASFPGALGAVLSGVPLVLHEGNSFPSRVNRWLAPRARLVISAQEAALEHLKFKRAEVVPFPVREERADRSEARARLGLPAEGLVTLVMGGSQGALALNRAVPAAYEAMSESERPSVLHSSGPGWEDELRERMQGHAGYHVHPYLVATDAWAAADLAITRAGAGTLSEAALHGVPLVMVPLPSAAEDHQLHNAHSVEAAGAGKVLQERHIERLKEVWLAALEPGWRQTARAAALKRSPEGAAELILQAAKGALTR